MQGVVGFCYVSPVDIPILILDIQLLSIRKSAYRTFCKIVTIGKSGLTDFSKAHRRRSTAAGIRCAQHPPVGIN